MKNIFALTNEPESNVSILVKSHQELLDAKLQRAVNEIYRVRDGMLQEVLHEVSLANEPSKCSPNGGAYED